MNHPGRYLVTTQFAQYLVNLSYDSEQNSIQRLGTDSLPRRLSSSFDCVVGRPAVFNAHASGLMFTTEVLSIEEMA